MDADRHSGGGDLGDGPESLPGGDLFGEPVAAGAEDDLWTVSDAGLPAGGADADAGSGRDDVSAGDRSAGRGAFDVPSAGDEDDGALVDRWGADDEPGPRDGPAGRRSAGDDLFAGDGGEGPLADGWGAGGTGRLRRRFALPAAERAGVWRAAAVGAFLALALTLAVVVVGSGGGRPASSSVEAVPVVPGEGGAGPLRPVREPRRVGRERRRPRPERRRRQSRPHAPASVVAAPVPAPAAGCCAAPPRGRSAPPAGGQEFGFER